MVIARASSAAPQNPATYPSGLRPAHTITSIPASSTLTSSVPQQRPPPAVVTLYSTGGGAIVSAPSSVRSPALSGSSVTVLPASSRPPLSTSTNSGVSVYPIYGPRSEITVASAAAAPPSNFSSPVRLSVTSSPPVPRTTLSSSQPSVAFRPVYSSAEAQVHHYQVLIYLFF